MGTTQPNFRAVIQAGGPGTRMSVIDNIPKHLLPVGGMPMVERLVRQAIDAGARQIYVITGHFGHAVEAHFRKLTDLPPDLKLHFIRETTKRGDIGSLVEVPVPGGTILWSYGDLVTDMDFAELLRIHRDRQCDMTLASHYESYHVRLGELVDRRRSSVAISREACKKNSDL